MTIKSVLISISLLISGAAHAHGAWYFPVFGPAGVIGAYGYGFSNFIPVGYWLYPNHNGWSFYSYFNFHPRYATYASISYSPSLDTFAGSWGQASFYNAVAVAQGLCGRPDCKPVVWVQGGCAVATTSKSEQKLTWGVGFNRASAFQNSLSACTTTDGQRAPDCVERAWVCSN
jgi:hypothetical protein